MSGRMTGSTSARGYLGYDEIRILIKEFYGIDIGKDSRYKRDNAGVVYRSLTDYYVSGKDKNPSRHQFAMGKEKREYSRG